MAFGAYILPMPFVEKLATDLIHLRFQPKFIYYCDHLLRMHKLTWFRQTIIFFIINFYDLCFKWCWCLFILYHSLVIFPRDLFPFSLYHWFLWFVFQLSSDTNACSSFIILLSFSQVGGIKWLAFCLPIQQSLFPPTNQIKLEWLLGLTFFPRHLEKK